MDRYSVSIEWLIGILPRIIVYYCMTNCVYIHMLWDYNKLSYHNISIKLVRLSSVYEASMYDYLAFLRGPLFYVDYSLNENWVFVLSQ